MNPRIAVRCFDCDRVLPVEDDAAPPAPPAPAADPAPPPATRTPRPSAPPPTAPPPASNWSTAAKAAAAGLALVVALSAGAVLADRTGSDDGPTVTTTTEVVATQPLVGSTEAAYETCDEARASGATPLRTGDPGYRPALDQDGDGLACE